MGKIILNDIEYGIGISNGVNVDTTNLVEKDSIVTTLDDTVTDEQIPSAKAVYDKLSDLPTDSGLKCYTSLDELGLTAPITVGEIFNAMPDDTMIMIPCENIADNITDVPTSYGILTIKKKNNSRFSIEYQNSLGGSATDVKRWIGTLKGTDGTGLYWKELQIEVGVVITTDTIAKYGTEILKYPIGTWRIDSMNIGKQFTDLPNSEMAGIVEIDSIQPNKSPYEHAYGYRNYTIRDALSNIVYTRTLNSGTTVGTMQRDTGWQKMVSENIAKTALTVKIQTIADGSNFYFVKNGVCYVNYYFASKNSESAGAIIFENLPKPAETMNVTLGSAWAEVRANSTNLYLTGTIGASASCVGNFSYPVAD